MVDTCSVREAAERLSLSRSSVYKIIYAGELAVQRVGPRRGKVVVELASIADYKERGKAKAPSQCRFESARNRLRSLNAEVTATPIPALQGAG